MNKVPETVAVHSAGWVAQTWIAFIAAVLVTSLGIWFLPVDPWVKAFMAMGLLFTVGSTFSLAKTVRDQHEAETLRKRIDEARVNRIFAEHDPLKPAV
ncbi:MAG: YiaA/YiaB family inner membrane protein [Myxococcaceae bacterium]